MSVMQRLFCMLFFLLASVPCWSALDRIVAVVDEGVILESELERKMMSIKQSLRANGTPMPPDSVLARQVLERLVLDKVQLLQAERAGIHVDDETLRSAVEQIAQRNNLTIDQFRRSLQHEGIEYSDFLNQIRSEIAISRFRSSQVNGQIKVSDREVQHYLDTKEMKGESVDVEYALSHILIATPSSASSAQVRQARERAEKLMAELKAGLDFRDAALRQSDDEAALTGGDLGWRKLSQLPTLFADEVPHMKKGQLAGPFHNPSGYHIIRLTDVRGGESIRLTKTHVRHILIKPNEVLSDDEARNKLVALKTRIENGDDFSELARAHSDDKGSAIKGGDLGWVQPGALVPPFEEAMNGLDDNQLSAPVQTQFGWHLIQVLGRQESTDGDEVLKTRARDEIFRRKVEEETELWLRKLRDEAYVEIRLEDNAVDPTESFMR